eukprot:13310764-Alexandrium_andersonii.AAC.1
MCIRDRAESDEGAGTEWQVLPITAAKSASSSCSSCCLEDCWPVDFEPSDVCEEARREELACAYASGPWLEVPPFPSL